MTTGRYRNRYAPWIFVLGTAAAWLTWRWVALGVEISSLQRQLADHLRATPGDATETSRRVATVIQADESLLDRAISLGSARHMLLWAAIATWLLALVLSWFWWRTRDELHYDAHSSSASRSVVQLYPGLRNTMARILSRIGVAIVAALICPPGLKAQETAPIPWTLVETALGRKGALQPGDVIRFSFPRRDLTVTVDGVSIRPALALGSWAAFKRVSAGHTMVMGDLVVLESEVNDVITELQKGGVEQTALHNHVLFESPRTMYLHIGAHGDEKKIAAAIRSALARTATPLDAPPATTQPGIDLDTAAIARTLGYPGAGNGGVYQTNVPRAERIREGRNEVPPSMGLATVINFQSTGSGRAAITGDFVMTASEVNKVIRALRNNGISITALHSHMLTESPRLFFMHFWANDDALKLARGLRTALDQTNSRRSPR